MYREREKDRERARARERERRSEREREREKEHLNHATHAGAQCEAAYYAPRACSRPPHREKEARAAAAALEEQTVASIVQRSMRAHT